MNYSEFEKYWKEHKFEILNADDEYNKAKESFKMNSGSDWLLFAIPVVAGLVFMQYVRLENEILNWIASACVIILCFIVCVLVKSITSGNVSLDDIETRIKKRIKQTMCDNADNDLNNH